MTAGYRRIARFSVLRTATTVAIVVIGVVLVLGLPAAVVGLVLVAEPVTSGPGSPEFLLLSLVLPFFYGFIAWPIAAVACIIYNLAARWLGGIEVVVIDDAPAQPDSGEGEPI